MVNAFHVVFLVVCLLITNVVIGQDDDSFSDLEWQKINASKSKEELNRYAKYLKTYFDWDVAVQEFYLLKGHKAALALEHDSLTFRYSMSLGSYYLGVDSLFQSINFFNQALLHSVDNSSKGEALNLLGYTYRVLEDYSTALDYYFKAVEAREESPKSQSYILVNISSAYEDLEDYNNAIKYIQNARQLASQLGFPEREYVRVFIYTYLSSFYETLDMVDSATHYTDLALESVVKFDTIQVEKYRSAYVMAYSHATDFYLDQKMSEIAYTYLQKSKKYDIPLFNREITELEGRYQMLKNNYEGALSLFDEINLENLLFKEKEDVIGHKIECYKALNNTDKVIELYDDLIKYQKEATKSNGSKYAILADAKYETYKKNEEINTLLLDKQVNQLTIQNQKYLVILAVGAVLLLLGIAISFWRRFQNRKKLSVYLQNEVYEKTKDLQKANEELRILNYVASHDIKEPMRNIGNYVGLIKRKLPDDLKLQLNDYFTTIQGSVKQLYTLVEDIATYLSMSNEDMEEQANVDMNELIRSLFFSLDSYVSERNGELINRGIPNFTTRPTLIYVILKNLIENGLKYNEAAEPSVELSYSENERYHQILVKDNGIGIDEKYHEQIFKSFKKLHNRSIYTGSGIGLSIVKLLVEKLNGDIQVESVVGSGTTVILNLPK